MTNARYKSPDINWVDWQLRSQFNFLKQLEQKYCSALKVCVVLYYVHSLVYIAMLGVETNCPNLHSMYEVTLQSNQLATFQTIACIQNLCWLQLQLASQLSYVYYIHCYVQLHSCYVHAVATYLAIWNNSLWQLIVATMTFTGRKIVLCDRQRLW